MKTYMIQLATMASIVHHAVASPEPVVPIDWSLYYEESSAAPSPVPTYPGHLPGEMPTDPLHPGILPVNPPNGDLKDDHEDEDERLPELPDKKYYHLWPGDAVKSTTTITPTIMSSTTTTSRSFEMTAGSASRKPRKTAKDGGIIVCPGGHCTVIPDTTALATSTSTSTSTDKTRTISSTSSTWRFIPSRFPSWPSWTSIPRGPSTRTPHFPFPFPFPTSLPSQPTKSTSVSLPPIPTDIPGIPKKTGKHRVTTWKDDSEDAATATPTDTSVPVTVTNTYEVTINEASTFQMLTKTN